MEKELEGNIKGPIIEEALPFAISQSILLIALLIGKTNYCQ